jgi:hypothetical protein
MGGVSFNGLAPMCAIVRSLLFALLVSAFSFHVRAEALTTDWDSLRAGAVIVQDIESDDGLPGVGATFLVRASRDQIWKVLVDHEHFREIFDGIERIEVLEEDRKGAKVAFWVDAVLEDLHYVLYREYTRRGHELRWKRLSGDLERIEGRWLIEDSPGLDEKLLVYRSFVKVGGIVPTRLVRFGAKRKAEEMGNRLRKWIESHK